MEHKYLKDYSFSVLKYWRLWLPVYLGLEYPDYATGHYLNNVYSLYSLHYS